MVQGIVRTCPGACVRVLLHAALCLQASVVNGPSCAGSEATSEFSELVAQGLSAGCLWMSSENLGQFVKCDAWAALHWGRDFVNFHLNVVIHKEGGTKGGL